jgi:hypothetical protein
MNKEKFTIGTPLYYTALEHFFTLAAECDPAQDKFMKTLRESRQKVVELINSRIAEFHGAMKETEDPGDREALQRELMKSLDLAKSEYDHHTDLIGLYNRRI